MTTPTAINPATVTRSDILTQLDTFLAGQADADKWQDYFSLGAGTTIKELIGALGAFIKYNSLTALRENSLLTAKLRSVIYGIADTLGYPINRATAVKVKLTVNSTADVYWDRNTPLGTINGQTISLEQSQLIQAGSRVLDVVLGQWQTQTQTVADSTDFSTVDFAITDIDNVDADLFEVYLNNTLTPTSRFAEEIYNGRLIVKTLTDSISLLTGNTLTGVNVLVGDVVQINYLELSSTQLTDTSTYIVGNVSLADSTMTPSAITVSRPYSAPDSLEKIVGLAPAYYSTRRRMVTKDDHVALVKSYTGMRDAAFNGGICSNQDYFTQADCEANGGTWDNGKVGCCTVGMSYLFEDEHTFINSDEETLVLDYLEQFRMPPGGIIFRDPEVVLVSPTLNITVTTSANTTTIRSSIQTYMTSVTLRLGATFNVADLVDYVSDLDGVTRCYVTQPLSDKKLVFYKYFKLGNLITNFSVATTDLNNFGSTSSDVGYS